MNWKLFASAYLLIVVAELPGKTTFASLLLSARTRPLPVFIGAASAFVIHTLIAVAAGGLLGLLPPRLVQTAAGAIFLALAVILWREKQNEKALGPIGASPRTFAQIAASAFGLIFIAQWGDPTQLATAALAAKYSAFWTIFVSATLALWTVSGLAVLIGHFAKEKIHPLAVQKAAAALFAAAGLIMLAQALLK